MAQSFFFSKTRPEGAPEIMMGAMALLPAGDGSVVAVDLLANLQDQPRRLWDLKVAAETWRE